MAIEVRNVSKSFNGFHALEDVSLTVPDGSLTALLGLVTVAQASRMTEPFARPQLVSVDAAALAA